MSLMLLYLADSNLIKLENMSVLVQRGAAILTFIFHLPPCVVCEDAFVVDDGV